jgi:riboflavin transporter FmnP
MHTTLRLAGVLGGALALVCGAAALVVGGPDTVIVGALMTIVAGVIAVVGTALAGARPGRAALLMIVAVLLAGSVAPGVIPALADTAVIFMAYLAGLGLLLIGAIVVFRQRKTAPTAALAGLHA